MWYEHVTLLISSSLHCFRFRKKNYFHYFLSCISTDNTSKTCSRLWITYRSLILGLPRPLTCVFGRFAVHGPRMGTPLESTLGLSRVALIRGLSWTRIRTCWTHWSGRVVGITCVRLHHVRLWRVSLRWHLAWVDGSSGSAALVRRGLLEIHVWLKSSPKK